MKKRLERLNPSVVFLISLLLFLVPLMLYLFSWIPGRKAELSERYLRATAMMSEQFETRGRNIATVIDENMQGTIEIPALEGISVELTIWSWLKLLVPIPDLELTYQRYKNLENAFGDVDKFYVNVNYNPSLSQFEFDIEKDVKIRLSEAEEKRYRIHFGASIGLKDFVKEICKREEFDDVLILDEKGELIYNREQYGEEGIKSGLRISKIGHLFETPAHNDKSPGTQDKGKDEDCIHSCITDITIAGSEYKLFIQPIPLRFIKPSLENTKANKNGANDQKTAQEKRKQWYICGLLSADTFLRRSQRISNNVLLAFVLLLVLAFVCFPLLKLWLMGRRDRFRPRDVIFSALSLVFGIPLVTYLFITSSAYLMDKNSYEEELKRLANDVHDRFIGEIGRAHDQLMKLFVTEELPSPDQNRGGGREILKKMSRDQLVYPYFDMLYIIDKDGEQVYKGVAGNTSFSFLDVSERRYFTSIKEEKYWYTKDNEPMMLDPVYSNTTGVYELNLSIPIPGKIKRSIGSEFLLLDAVLGKNTKADPGKELAVAGMSFRPLSVIKPVLPYGYGFAIIDAQGKVIFHSTHRLNSYENFFCECDQASALKAAVFARSELDLTASYQGQTRQLFLKPIENMPWTLILFKDVYVHGSRNLERLSISFIQYTLYLFVLLGLLAIGLLFGLVQKRMADAPTRLLHTNLRWLWPDKDLRLKYTWIALLNLFLFLLLLVQLYFLGGSFRFPLIVPLIVSLMIYAAIMKCLVAHERVKHFLAPIGLSILVLFILFRFNGWFFANFSLAHGIIFIPIILYPFLFFVPGSNGKGKLSNRWFYRNSHTLVLWSLALLFIAYPGLTFYKYAYEKEQAAAVKHDQVTLARDYLDWQRWRRSSYKFQEPLVHQKPKLKEDFNTLGVYPLTKTEIKDFFEMVNDYIYHVPASPSPLKIPLTLTAAAEDTLKTLAEPSPHFLPMPDSILLVISRLIPFESKYSERIRGLYNQFSSDYSLRWQDLTEPVSKEKKLCLGYHEKYNLDYKDDGSGVESVYVVSDLPKMPRQGKNFLLLLIAVASTVLFLTVILFIVVHFLGNAVFLRDVEISPTEESPITDRIKLSPGRFFVFANPPAIERSKRQLKRADCLEIDCKAAPMEEAFKQNISPDTKYVVIYNFHHDMHDAGANLKKLAFLEKLVFSHELNIMVFSPFEPRQYFTLFGSKKKSEKNEKNRGSEEEGQSPEALARRWDRVLKHFDSRYLVIPPAKRKTAENLPEEWQGFIDNESANLEYLYPVRERILREFLQNSNTPLELPALKDRFAEYAGPIYDAIWQASTKEEKLVMVQLAQEGLVNIKNKEVIRRLLKRKLIRKNPLRLMNDTFTHHVDTAEDLDTILFWKKGEIASSWTKLRRPFLFLVIGIILFLVLTQPGILKSWLVLIPAISGLIPALLRLIDQLSGSAGDGSTE